MMNRMQKILAPPVFDDETATYEAKVINALLWMALVFTGIALVLRVFIQDLYRIPSLIINTLQLAVWLLLFIPLRLGKTRLAGNLLIVAIFITLNIQAYISGGLHRPIIYVNVIALAITTLFSNRRVVWFAVLAVGSVTLMYFLDGVLLPAPTEPFPIMPNLIVFSLITIFAAFILQFAASNLRNAMARINESEKQLMAQNRELQNYQQALEAQVNDRTEELNKRTNELELVSANSRRRAEQFEALAQVMQSIISVRDLQALLPLVAAVISERYGFYHVGVFLIDEANEYAILAAANSPGGKKMLERRHRLKVGQQGIVGSVTASGEPRIALDVGEDAVFFNNPDLPETRSEMALPLQSGGNIIGALDVQSTQAGAFSNEDVQTLSLLAEQVSLAIENARLFERSSRTLNELQMVMRQSTREAWKRMPEQQNVLGFRYDAMGTTPLKEPVKLEEFSRSQGKAADAGPASVVVPIELRGEVIGNLAVHSPSGREWNKDQQDLIRAVAERVALSAENARLFEETTHRAERERLVSEITGKIRSHNDPQTMIETAILELRNALGASRVDIIPRAAGKDTQV